MCPFAVEDHQPYESRAVAGRRQLFVVHRYIFVVSSSGGVLFKHDLNTDVLHRRAKHVDLCAPLVRKLKVI